MAGEVKHPQTSPARPLGMTGVTIAVQSCTSCELEPNNSIMDSYQGLHNLGGKPRIFLLYGLLIRSLVSFKFVTVHWLVKGSKDLVIYRKFKCPINPSRGTLFH